MKIDDRKAVVVPPRPAPPAPQPAAPVARWQYKRSTMDLNADLTQFGQEGWELVSVVPIPYDPNQAVFHFKKKL